MHNTPSLSIFCWFLYIRHYWQWVHMICKYNLCYFFRFVFSVCATSRNMESDVAWAVLSNHFESVIICWIYLCDFSFGDTVVLLTCPDNFLRFSFSLCDLFCFWALFWGGLSVNVFWDNISSTLEYMGARCCFEYWHCRLVFYFIITATTDDIM